jgi:hypothetical protein
MLIVCNYDVQLCQEAAIRRKLNVWERDGDMDGRERKAI